MKVIIASILVLTAYIGITYFLIRLVRKYTSGNHKYFRLLSLSFAYALFWGLGIAAAGNGGDSGFALPAPNLVALGLMASAGYYQGLMKGLIILGFWWTIIFIGMFLWQMKRDKKAGIQDQQP